MRSSKTFVWLSLIAILAIGTQAAYADINWIQRGISNTFDGAQDVYAADFDGDGDNDVLSVASFSGVVGWFENVNGDGATWALQTIDGTFPSGQCVFAADLDGDGDMDALASSYSYDNITWWENVNGDGLTWTLNTLTDTFDGANCVRAADMDGDGDMDILGVASSADQITWWENVNGDGSLFTETPVLSINGARVAEAFDMDNDGDIDIVASAGGIIWLENVDGDGLNWTTHNVNLDFDYASSLSPGDMDGDGDIDIASAADYIADDITWWENNDGAGTSWTQRTINDFFDEAISVFATDVDGDNDLDIIGAARYGDDVTWWENELGDGSLWIEWNIDASFSDARAVHAADFDNDGNIDIVGAARNSDMVKAWISRPEPPIVVDITPQLDPTIVSQGGIFFYDLMIDYNIVLPTFGTIWTEVILPNGNTYGPMFYVNFFFTPDMQITVTNIMQQIPAMAPPGEYDWVLNAGPNQNMALGTDSFPFTIVAAQAANSATNQWASDGEDKILAAIDDETTVDTGSTLPGEFMLSAAYPNPFNAMTTLNVSLPETAPLTVTVYNTNGQQVATLANSQFNAGSHELSFNANNLASGLYFVRATVPGQFEQMQKVMLVR